MEHAAIKVLVLSSLGALEACDPIFLRQGNLLGASEMTTLFLPYLNNESLNAAFIVALVVGSDNPKLAIVVVHLSGTKVAEPFLLVTLSAICVCLGPIKQATLGCPGFVALLHFTGFFVQ